MGEANKRAARRRTNPAYQPSARHDSNLSGQARNQPCPCGSGRKTKRCCIARVQLEETWDMIERRAVDSGSLVMTKAQADAAQKRVGAGEDPAKVWDEIRVDLMPKLTDPSGQGPVAFIDSAGRVRTRKGGDGR